VPTLVVHLPMAVRVPQDKMRECLPAAICTASEMVAGPAALLEERLAADETSAILGLTKVAVAAVLRVGPFSPGAWCALQRRVPTQGHTGLLPL
jgi:hypothetical protein